MVLSLKLHNAPQKPSLEAQKFKTFPFPASVREIGGNIHPCLTLTYLSMMFNEMLIPYLKVKKLDLKVFKIFYEHEKWVSQKSQLHQPDCRIF